MSCSTLYRVFKTKSTPIKEYRNGWLTGPIIWDFLSKKYISPDFHWMTAGQDLDKLWDVWKNPKVTRSLKVAQLLTCDFAVINKEHAKEASELLIEAALILKNNGHNSHFKEIGQDILNDNCKDKRLIGYGLGCTSVSDPWEQEDSLDRKLAGVFESLKEIEII